MLKPDYIDHLPDALVELYGKAERDIIADMVRRIITYDYFIPAAEFQFRKLQEMGLIYDEILKRLSTAAQISEDDLEKLIREAGAEALKHDDSVYRKAGKVPTPFDADPTLQNVLVSGIEKTKGLFRNLTKTTANTASKQFENALDRAYMQITTGAFDYNSAVRSVVKDIAQKGVAVIEYPSKKPGIPGRTDYMEVAVRRATVTGINQTAARLQDTRAAEMGCDLVETTAHAGAREDHLIWQGKIFSRSGTHPKYPDFVKSTGYGTGPGLCGWNCRHSFFPFIEGVSEPALSKSELKNLEAKEYNYNGQEMDEYEATQKQRYIERQIRRWKREYVAMEAAKLPTAEAVTKISSWRKIQQDFLNQTGLKQQADREIIGGYDKSKAQKVVQAKKKQVKAYTQEHVESIITSTPLKTILKKENSGIIKAKAKYFSNRDEADKLFRPWTEEAWPGILPDERTAAYHYTAGSGKFNRPLRGYDQSWSNYVGTGSVPLNNEGAEKMIGDLKQAITKVELKEDVWLFRGSDQQSLAGLLGIDKSKVIPSNIAALNSKFSGTRIEDPGFFSTGIAADAGFSDKISYEILAPAGTKGIYAEPFSHFGGTNQSGTWDGKQKPTYVGSEAEVILQAGTAFEIVEMKLVSDKVTVVLKAIVE